MKKAAIYIRVSTVEQKQHGLSVYAQQLALEEYCKNNNIEIYNIYSDAGISAHIKYKKRPALLQLIKDANDHKFDVILFTKLDRWFRSVKDYYSVMEQIPDTIPWKAIWEDYETETSAGKFKVNIMLSVAQAESDRTSERIKVINDYKQTQGKYVGTKAPIGYILEKGCLIKDKQNEECINKVFECYLTTFSLVKCQEILKSNGTPRSKAKTLYILKNPTYAGKTNKGHICEPYITLDQRENIINNLKKSTRETKSKQIYKFSGLLRCSECGYRMSARSTKHIDRNGNAYYIKCYQCNKQRMDYNCIGAYENEDKIEKYLLENIEHIIEHDIIVESSKRKDCEDIAYKIIKLEERLSRIGDRYEEGELTKEQYKKKRYDIKAEIETLKNTNKVKIPNRLPENWKEIYSELDEEHKSSFWKSIIDTIYVSRSNERKIKWI